MKHFIKKASRNLEDVKDGVGYVIKNKKTRTVIKNEVSKKTKRFFQNIKDKLDNK